MPLSSQPISIARARFFLSRWDLLAVPLVLGTLALIALGASQMARPIGLVESGAIHLDPIYLPDYALRTVLRMGGALAASLIFTFVYATLAAKSRRLGMVLIPILDILQSIPVLGFISFTILAFMHLFPGSALGPECAAIFAIFTSQAWNMAFSFYQSLRNLPRDLDEAARTFRLSPWQRFWRLEVPFAMPGLVWNTMMSMSGGWFFVVAAETITLGNQRIALPGIGSYVGLAIERENLTAIGWAVLAMGLVILIYDQLLFRPLVAWAQKFRFEQSAGGEESSSWILELMQHSPIITIATRPIGRMIGRMIRLRLAGQGAGPARALERFKPSSRSLDLAWFILLALAAAYGAWVLARTILPSLGPAEIGHALGLGFLTALRVITLIILASLVWVPAGIWIGLRPRLAQAIQPAAQFLAGFPANLLFPIAIFAIVRFRLDPDIWLSPLMILGTQWYILFNVVAGASAFPNDLREAATNFRIRGWRWWFKVMLPGVFPYYITGAITASGGSWNASIVAEWVSWGPTHLSAHGLGAYIAAASAAGDYPRIILGIAVMSLFVLMTNRLLWRPLYGFAERRLRLG